MFTFGSSLCLLFSLSSADATFYTSPGFTLFSPLSCCPPSYHHFLPRNPQWPPNWSLCLPPAFPSPLPSPLSLQKPSNLEPAFQITSHCPIPYSPTQGKENPPMSEPSWASHLQTGMKTLQTFPSPRAADEQRPRRMPNTKGG